MPRELHDGKSDNFVPLKPLDLSSVNSVSSILDAMSMTSFGARELGEAFAILLDMIRDQECLVVATISGAMTIAQMGRVFCEMIKNKMVDIIVSTGALMAHGLSEAIGGIHYRYDPSVSDELLYKWGYNRVYDTLELEANLSAAETLIIDVLSKLDCSEPIGSAKINQMIGSRLVEQGLMPSVLGYAYVHKVPIYVPAFTDSALGLAMSASMFRISGTPSSIVTPFDLHAQLPNFNPYCDLHDYFERVCSAKRLGILTIGGGVPRNWGQQVGPYAEIINARYSTELPIPRFQYAVRICPEPVHLGGLSGCTYSEGLSWGKFVSPEEGGLFAEVHCDATIAIPLLIYGVLERIQAESKSNSPEGTK